ncbi:MAG: HlyD family secretion protein [Alphaproteobacteria bacterium]|nr:HlyD family secretion protein [Alphaproteobacteria bacterium]MBL7096208.1 HlyD family secretion protein [Alphaproteobacteria bacterium]
MSSVTYEETITAPVNLRPTRALPKRALLVAGAAIVLAAIGAWWIATPASSVSTDDAYLKADSTIVAPRVHGLVAEVLVRDNQTVHAGQPLIRIDDDDYRQALSAAEADVQTAQAALDQFAAQRSLAAANAAAAAASIRAADAENVRAAADRVRFEKLAASGDISRSQADTARAAALSAAADSDKMRATLAAATQQVNVVDQTKGQLLAALARADAALTLARQNEEHTIVRAPVDGQIGDRQVQLGEYVQPGTQLLTVVPMNTMYVVANFKETQTARMLIGQKARIIVDALNGETIDGTVESFAPGSGSEFSLLPFEPATGNFTRIVQRVPVRIRLNPNQPDVQRLRPGLSADVRVDLR